MQPPFDEFNPILNGGASKVKVTINKWDAIETGLNIVTEDDDISQLHERPGGSMVLMHEGEKWTELIKKATSFSCSIGPKVAEIIGPTLKEALPEVPELEQPILYGCENDHSAVEKLGKLLRGRVRVVPCMVDRICSARVIQVRSSTSDPSSAERLAPTEGRMRRRPAPPHQLPSSAAGAPSMRASPCSAPRCRARSSLTRQDPETCRPRYLPPCERRHAPRLVAERARA